MTSFSNTYPSIHNELEKIRTKSRLHQLADQELNHLEYIKRCSPQQNKCKNEYKPPKNKIISAKSPNRIEHCSKCHKTRYKK
jgi:hypothetical protein